MSTRDILPKVYYLLLSLAANFTRKMFHIVEYLLLFMAAKFSRKKISDSSDFVSVGTRVVYSKKSTISRRGSRVCHSRK